MRYAQAVSSGGVAAVLTPQPTQSQVDAAEGRWRQAMGEVLACRLSHSEALRTGLAGAVELATMSAVATDGSGQPNKMLLARYAKSLVEQAFSPGARPDAARCRTVTAWSNQVRKQGQKALGRAIAEGFVPLL